MPEKNSFCHACGTQYTEMTWPRQCPNCHLMVWKRINPVSVLIQPARDRATGRLGVVIGQRGIAPGIGDYALPGGHIEFGELPETAAVREMWEETGVMTRSRPVYFDSFADDVGFMLLFFTTQEQYTDDILAAFVPCDECSAIKIAYEPEQLVFESHTRALESFLQNSN